MLSKFTCSKAHLFCKGGTWMSQSHVKLKHLGHQIITGIGFKDLRDSSCFSFSGQCETSQAHLA